MVESFTQHTNTHNTTPYCAPSTDRLHRYTRPLAASTAPLLACCAHNFSSDLTHLQLSTDKTDTPRPPKPRPEVCPRGCFAIAPIAPVDRLGMGTRRRQMVALENKCYMADGKSSSNGIREGRRAILEAARWRGELGAPARQERPISPRKEV